MVDNRISLLPLLRPVPLSVLAEDPTILDDAVTDVRFLVFDDGSLERSEDTTQRTAPHRRRVRAVEGDEELEVASSFLVVALDAGTQRVTLGRSRARCGVVIRDVRVSAVHAAIAPGESGRHWLVDLSSSNGTFIDGRCIAPGESGRVPLRVGAKFCLAQVELVFVDALLLTNLISVLE